MGTAQDSPEEAPFRRASPGQWLRWAAWTALVAVAAALVRAEVVRPALPAGIDAYTDIVYRRVDRHSERLDVYVPASPAPQGGRPAVLAIHGGGWRGGSKNGYGREVAQLAQHGYVVIAPTYRLSRPGAPSWPENLEDLREAVRWIRRHATDYGIDPNRIVAMGASAGAHLAELLGTDPDSTSGGPWSNVDANDEPTSARVQAVVAFFGPSDLRTNFHASPVATTPITLLLGGSPDELPLRYDEASPLHHVSPSSPPMLLIHGELDPLVPVSQSEILQRALIAAGVPSRLVVVGGARHGFGMRAPERDLAPEILDFLNHVWNDE
jgi:acetyl esterase/lipase